LNNVLKIKKIFTIENGKDISGIYIVILAVIYGTFYDFVNNFSSELSYTVAFVNTTYLIPVCLVVYIFERIAKIDCSFAKRYFIVLFVYFILSIFFNINASFGVAIILFCSVAIFLILIFCKIIKIAYKRPLLHLAIVSFFSFLIVSIY